MVSEWSTVVSINVMSTIHHTESRPGPAALAAIALLCAACGVADQTDATGSSRADSAGVQIVRNTDDPLPRGELVQPGSM